MTDFPRWPYIVRNAIQGNTPGYAIYKVSFVKFIPEDFETGNSFEKLQAELDRLNAECRKEQTND